MVFQYDPESNHGDWVREFQTVNQVYYKVPSNLRERAIRRKRRPELWKNCSWVLHQDNSPAHIALSVKMFLTKHKITALEHPPNSPHLDHVTFFFTSKDQVCVKRYQVRVRRCSEGKSD
jgi:hypothetical protein